MPLVWGARHWSHGNDCNLSKTTDKEVAVAVSIGCKAVIR